MAEFNRSALVHYSAEQMFALINDIESYPQFMQGCKRAQVLSRTDAELVGELTLSRAGIDQTFTTRNTLFPPRRMDMQLEKGSFKRLQASWRFDALNEEACKVTLQMSFEITSGMLDTALEKLMGSVANDLVDALVKRAGTVYGGR